MPERTCGGVAVGSGTVCCGVAAGAECMDGFDFSPLFRSVPLARCDEPRRRRIPGYLPYNIDKTGDDAYRLTMAVAGFSPSELNVTVHENTLLVTSSTCASASSACGSRPRLPTAVAGRRSGTMHRGRPHYDAHPRDLRRATTLDTGSTL